MPRRSTSLPATRFHAPGDMRYTVTAFGTGIHLLDDGEQVIGVVVGQLPDRKTRLWEEIVEHWHKIQQPAPGAREKGEEP